MKYLYKYIFEKYIYFIYIKLLIYLIFRILKILKIIHNYFFNVVTTIAPIIDNNKITPIIINKIAYSVYNKLPTEVNSLTGYIAYQLLTNTLDKFSGNVFVLLNT